jgi:hypothetical protein
LFFFSFEVGGCRRDCEKLGTFRPRTISIDRAIDKNRYKRLFIILYSQSDALASGLMRWI